MSVSYNGTNLSIVKYESTELDKVIYNDTTVYQRITVNYYCENTVYKSVKVISGNNVDLSSSNAANKSGWTFLGWRLDKTASSNVQSSIIADTVDINLYAVYRQTITLSYSGNGATSGSTASQTGYRYYNNGSTTNPSFTLRSNGFSRTNYRFVNWRMGSASGTAYNAGSSVTLANNTTFYASWTAIYTASTLTINGYAAYPRSQGVVPFMTVPSSGSVYQLNSCTITGNTLSLNAGNVASVKANIACSVKITPNLNCTAIDSWGWYLFYVAVYKNGSLVNELLYRGGSCSYNSGPNSYTCTTAYTISAAAGDIIQLRVEGGASDGHSGRTQYSGTVTITGTPS